MNQFLAALRDTLMGIAVVADMKRAATNNREAAGTMYEARR